MSIAGPDVCRDDYAGITALVLGASGFIGRWVARALCQRRSNVYLVVRDKDVTEEIFPEYNIYGEVCEVDLRNQESVRDLIQKVKPSIIFNLAGYGVDKTERDEGIAYEINAGLPESLCESMTTERDKRWSGQQIVHAGSALEYGTISSSEISENSEPKPTTQYGRSKLAGTQALRRCCQKHKISGLTARLFTVYGPGEHRGRLLPSLIETAVTRNDLPLSAGTQMRDFTYVEDVVQGLLRLGTVESAGPGEVVNLASGRLTSVRSFAEIAAAILAIPQERLIFGALPTRHEEMKHSAVTIERLKQLTCWKPTTTVEEGILKTMRFQSMSAAGTANDKPQQRSGWPSVHVSSSE